MRILHILNHVQEVGNGIVNVTIDLACTQSSSGHDVLVCSAGGEYEDLLERHGVRHELLDQTRSPTTLLKAVWSFQNITKKFRPDVVHAHMMTGALLAKLFVPLQHYQLVTHVHNEFQRAAIIMRVGDKVIAVSEAVASSMQRRGISKSKIFVVTNGVIGSPRQPPLANYQAAKLQHPALVTVAGMYKRKGISDLIEAFNKVAAQIPDVQLYLVGEGPDRALFEDAANQSPHKKQIHFEGFQKSPQPYLLAADIFVLASRQEPFGVVILEAREARCAIIATRVDGIPEALDDGKAGILVPPNDVSSLQHQITYLLKDASGRRQWKAKAHSDLEKFSVSRVADEVEKVYKKPLHV